MPLCYCAKLALDGADKCSGAQQPELGDALAKDPVQFPGVFAKRERSENRAAGCYLTLEFILVTAGNALSRLKDWGKLVER